MNEPLGIALELAEKRKAFASRLSPLARRMAFPNEHARLAEWRRETRRRITAGKLTEWSESRSTKFDKAKAAEARAAVIMEACARHWCVPAAMIYDPARKMIYVRPRYAVMRLMRELLGLSQPVSGVLLNRDPTSVLHGLRMHRQLYDLDADYRRRFDAAVAELRETLGNVATSDTAAAGGERDGCPRQPSPTLPANHGGAT